MSDTNYADVIIVGTGNAGFAAAVSASENGAKVLYSLSLNCHLYENLINLSCIKVEDMPVSFVASTKVGDSYGAYFATESKLSISVGVV